MKEEQDYIRDIAEIRSMMERSSKFLSLSGWAGIMAGLYALAGGYMAYTFFHFNPDALAYRPASAESLPNTLYTALLVLLSAIGTAVLLSYQKATKKGEKLWNSTAKRLLINMAVPLLTGGLLCLIVLNQGLLGLLIPICLIFYGMALYIAGHYTYKAIRTLGLIEIGLGLLSAYFIRYGLLCWMVGFGLLHIIYGIYMNYRYEK